ncbi:MAG TPA: dienelactone hydrolase family protein, partial [Flavisolibacter sp.]|nr:dienelactone hydrolase family protein [Flavisolibacter sp.]
MNKRKATIFLLQVSALFLLFFNNNLQAQSLTAKYVSTTGNSNGYYEYLPQGYASSSQTFPLIIFVEGIGELGDGSTGQLPKLLANGPLFYINAGQFPSSFTVNGKTSSFIIITPQYKAWPGAGDVDAVITYAIQHYKVDVSRIYLTGISMGGGVVWDYAGNNINYANRIAALLPFCGASGASTTKARNIAAANLPVWAFHNQYDPEVPASYTQNWISQINQAPAPNPLARQTIFNVGGHDAWSPAYY